MEQICNPIFDVTIHAFDTSSAVRLRSSPNLTPDRIFVLPFPVTLTTLTLNQRSSRRFGNYFWKSSPEGLPPSFPQLRAKLSCSRGTPDPCVRNYRTRLFKTAHLHTTQIKPSESMTDSRFGDSKVFYQFFKPIPIVAFAL